MNLLALDTSSVGTLVVARRADGRLAQRRHQPAGRERPAHTTLGLTLALQTLDELGLEWTQLDRIGAGIGPGSFTGLRAGLSAAAGLARRLECPLVGVTATALLAAGACEAADSELLTLVDGRRRELFAQRWTRRDATPTGDGPLAQWQAGPLTVVQRADLHDGLGDVTGVLAVGDGATLEADALRTLGAEVPDAGDSIHQLHAAAFAALVASQAPTAPSEVQLAYGRDADAVPTAERANR